MRFCRYHILFLFLLLFATIGLGQERKPIAVHFDKTFYVLGETVWYRALCMEDSKASQVMEVQIADQSGTVKLHQRLLMENNCAFGDFRIPLDWK